MKFWALIGETLPSKEWTLEACILLLLPRKNSMKFFKFFCNHKFISAKTTKISLILINHLYTNVRSSVFRFRFWVSATFKFSNFLVGPMKYLQNKIKTNYMRMTNSSEIYNIQSIKKRTSGLWTLYANTVCAWFLRKLEFRSCTRWAVSDSNDYCLNFCSDCKHIKFKKLTNNQRDRISINMFKTSNQFSFDLPLKSITVWGTIR